MKVYARLIFTGIIKELRRGRMLVNAEVKIVIIAGDIMKNSGRQAHHDTCDSGTKMLHL